MWRLWLRMCSFFSLKLASVCHMGWVGFNIPTFIRPRLKVLQLLQHAFRSNRHCNQWPMVKKIMIAIFLNPYTCKHYIDLETLSPTELTLPTKWPAMQCLSCSQLFDFDARNDVSSRRGNTHSCCLCWGDGDSVSLLVYKQCGEQAVCCVAVAQTRQVNNQQ